MVESDNGDSLSPRPSLRSPPSHDGDGDSMLTPAPHRPRPWFAVLRGPDAEESREHRQRQGKVIRGVIKAETVIDDHGDCKFI